MFVVSVAFCFHISPQWEVRETKKPTKRKTARVAKKNSSCRSSSRPSSNRHSPDLHIVAEDSGLMLFAKDLASTQALAASLSIPLPGNSIMAVDLT